MQFLLEVWIATMCKAATVGIHDRPNSFGSAFWKRTVVNAWLPTVIQQNYLSLDLPGDRVNSVSWLRLMSQKGLQDGEVAQEQQRRSPALFP
jgi:hypothetical protein